MKKKKGLLITGAVFAAVILIGLCVTVVMTARDVKCISAMLETGSISYSNSNAAQVVYEGDDEGQMPPSILTDYSLEFEGEDTISLKTRTIKCRASVTPAEFRQGTKARLKVVKTGKTYKLSQKDGSFEGAIRVPLTEAADVQVILEDDKTVRTENIYPQDAYIRTDLFWSAEWDQPQSRMGKDSVSLEWDIVQCSRDGDSSENAGISQIQVIGLTDGQKVYQKTIKGELRDTENEISWIFPWKGKVPLQGDKPVKLYAVAKAKGGLFYRYQIGQLQAGSDDFWGESYHYLEILAPDGSLLETIDTSEESEE